MGGFDTGNFIPFQHKQWIGSAWKHFPKKMVVGPQSTACLFEVDFNVGHVFV